MNRDVTTIAIKREDVITEEMIGEMIEEATVAGKRIETIGMIGETTFKEEMTKIVSLLKRLLLNEKLSGETKKWLENHLPRTPLTPPRHLLNLQLEEKTKNYGHQPSQQLGSIHQKPTNSCV